VLAADLGGAPAIFSMRGFKATRSPSSTTESGSARRHYVAHHGDGEPRTGRIPQGPSSSHDGTAAIGGSVNYVSKQPTTGPIKNELDTSIDTLGTYRTHFGSGGSTNVQGLRLSLRCELFENRQLHRRRLPAAQQRLGPAQLPVNDAFKVFAAVDYKRDERPRLLGTPPAPSR